MSILIGSTHVTWQLPAAVFCPQDNELMHRGKDLANCKG